MSLAIHVETLTQVLLSDGWHFIQRGSFNIEYWVEDLLQELCRPAQAGLRRPIEVMEGGSYSACAAP